ncbi:efflux RND transporter periplasmic adaptor subunit [Synechococcus elongatus]|uniref:Secretion protein HlyD n=2 Tax=Synechococcus elongatus TaxID=32046 RepID=Q31M19_SYNE7|nr:efflux RND transporter periplasmic adaptor subunit [Synechococcus elongatus]ABB57900.1 Secretion protein HlyD [Synechococcus elongatus PCC 7942 = FACHB-805]AJD57619.1 RND transporter [Synechococcus elongatus UTEX 2973]MBD2586617.1 efflux RND transporter periplasmic adaptor subunit [Synechococcus elongatus FACHB-242]MBD2687691.1 efflux RND transporter periplasmic adaptor subunit [Synechococcus elongatus FACHB-1061]MBD2706599.1 efflux RND transporter periplasmic adaptor subunit [Synechococcus
MTVFAQAHARLGLACLLVSITASGCQILPPSSAQTNREQQRSPITAVDAAVVERQPLQEATRYTGTTEPFQSVSLRAQVEGQVLGLSVDVGDPVQSGQLLARLDDRLQSTAVVAAAAEVAARQSEVASQRAEVIAAMASVEQARLQLQQARSDAARLTRLFQAGAISAQEAETAQTAVLTAEQAVRTAQQQVQTRQQAVAAAERRVVAQQAIANQEQARRNFTQLIAPVTGLVLERSTEAGNLAREGDEILTIGDFSRIKVVLRVSELELANLRVGQSVQVRLDAFPKQTFTGQISRIAPVADRRTRLIPVEITMPNPDGRIGSGLLARVVLSSSAPDPIVVPEAALSTGETPTTSDRGTVFVVKKQGDRTTTEARSVRLGPRADGRVVIQSGLQAGETIVVRSASPLKAGQQVRLSILSTAGDQNG